MLLIARIVDLVLDPVIGVTIDRTRSRVGKFRPYLLFGPLPLGVLAIMCFTAPGVGDGLKMLYATVLYSLFSIAYAVVNVAYAAMLPSLTGDYYQRGVISGIRELVGTVAILVVNSGTLFFVHRFGSEAVGFPIVMAIYAAVATLTLWVVFGGSRGVGERPSSEPEAKPVPLRAMLRTLAGNTPLYQVLGFNFASILAAGVHLATMVYYFKYYLERDDLFPPFQLVSTLAMFAAMFSVPMLVRRTGKRAAHHRVAGDHGCRPCRTLHAEPRHRHGVRHGQHRQRRIRDDTGGHLGCHPRHRRIRPVAIRAALRRCYLRGLHRGGRSWAQRRRQASSGHRASWGSADS